MKFVLSKRPRLFVILLSLCAALIPMPALGEDSVWRTLEPGVELAVFTPVPRDFQPIAVVAARFDPEHTEFVLLNASRSGTAASLTGWTDKEQLIAAINASMYLPDAVTSTGYMRSGDHLNNPRIVTKFGAFFVAGPRPGAEHLPRAGILDRDVDPWEERLPHYETVIQNYRLINASGRMLWTPGGPSYAAAAVGEDRAGRIVFLHCREPMTGAEFGDLLLTLPLDLRVVMYVEGGSQACLLLRAGDVDTVWMGRHAAGFLALGNKSAPLPNVIGVKRRTQAAPAKPSASPAAGGAP